MIEKINTGIILRSYFPAKSILVLIDDELGKISALCNVRKYQPIMHASLLWYIRNPWRTMHIITFYELTAIPDQWVISDIYFMHHVLELSLFFLPEHKHVRDVFELLMIMYKPCPYKKKSLYKKIFIYQFFSLLSIYPEQQSLYDSSFIDLISQPDDIMLNVHDEDVLHKHLNNWISECIKVHPQKDTLKTSNFLKYMD